MGKRDRERIERIKLGLEQPISEHERRAVVAAASNSVTRNAIKLSARGEVVKTLQQAPLDQQIEVLNSIKPDAVGRAIMKKAPREMDKGIARMLKAGEDVTVDKLLQEVRETPGFLQMCERAGLTYAWFENLARERMTAAGLEVK